MKTKQITYVLLAFVVVLITACNWPSGDEKPNENEIVTEPCSDANCPELDFSSNPSRITRSEANAREELYKSTHYEMYGANLQDSLSISYQDYREFNFSVDDMRCYLKYIENYADSLGYTNVGLRAYIGAKNLGDGKIVSNIFFVPSGIPPSQGTAMQVFPVPPNIPGADAFNEGQAGMPPTELVFP